MFRLTPSCGLAVFLALLCLGEAPAHAQAAPLQYWIPGGPFGFGGVAGQSADSYGIFPSFNGGDASGRSNSNGFFVGSQHGNLNWSGLSPAGLSGNFSALSYDSTQFGYNTKTAGGMPVTFFAGFDTLKYGGGIGSSLAPLTSSASPGYGAFAGVEFKPDLQPQPVVWGRVHPAGLGPHGQRSQIEHAARRVAGVEWPSTLTSA
ncbi:hypothetical protein ACVWZL_001536 [Bradyrhizobium sp. GM2.4]